MFYWLESKKKLAEENKRLNAELIRMKQDKEAFIIRCNDLEFDNLRLRDKLAKNIKEPQTIILIDKRRSHKDK